MTIPVRAARLALTVTTMVSAAAVVVSWFGFCGAILHFLWTDAGSTTGAVFWTSLFGGILAGATGCIASGALDWLQTRSARR